MSNKFSKIPLTPLEKVKKTEKFLENIHEDEKKDLENEKKFKKVPMKAFLLKLPNYTLEELRELSALTGINMSAICIDLLRPAVKNKLKDTKDI